MEFNAPILYQDNKITGYEFCQKIRSEIGDDCVEIRQRVISSYAKDIPKVIMDGVREVGKENIIIDLTCGKKDITGSLYTAASISQIPNMIYVEVPRTDGAFPKLERTDYLNIKDKFFLTRYESLDEIENLASLNEMDFIFYKKNIQEIKQAINSPKIESYCSQIGHVVEEYFSGNEDNYRNAIRTMGLINEELVKSLGRELYDKFSDLGLKNYNEKRSLDTIRELEEIYQRKETAEEIRKRLNPVFSKMPAIFEMVEILRVYRNRASHYDDCVFKKEDVKLLLDMLILLFCGLIESELASEIWGQQE
jgi:ribosomal protein S17E